MEKAEAGGLATSRRCNILWGSRICTRHQTPLVDGAQGMYLESLQCSCQKIQQYMWNEIRQRRSRMTEQALPGLRSVSLCNSG